MSVTPFRGFHFTTYARICVHNLPFISTHVISQAYEDTSSPKGPTNVKTQVRIVVEDVNDETPTFSASKFLATVKENTQSAVPITFMPAGTEMKVVDKDKVRNSFGMSLA